MADTEVHDYNDANRAFLQAFLARGMVTLDTAKPILAAIFSVDGGSETSIHDVTIEDLNSYISAANSALSPLDLEIRSAFHQTTRERCYALVNTTSDPLTQLATTYNAEEIAYVKKLLDAMFDGPNNRGKKEAMCLSGMEAVQLGRAARRETQNGASHGSTQGLNMREAESMLGKMVEEGWLEKSRKGFYSLSPRALMELKGWLIDTYNEPADEAEEADSRERIKFCHACKEMITIGQRCARPECRCRLHDICTVNFFRMRRSQTCPLCEAEWDGKHFVGEKSITTAESYLKGKRRSTNKPSDGADVDAQENNDP